MSVVIGFDANRKKRTESLKYFNCCIDGKKKVDLGENEIFIPAPAIIAIANMKIDKVNIFFETEAKQNSYPPK